MKLLLAGAKESTVVAMSSALERNFCGVDTVYNGEDAFYFGLTGKYDAIILDSALPGCSAYEVERMLKMVKEDSKIVIINPDTPRDPRGMLDMLAVLGETVAHTEPGVLAFGDLRLSMSGCEVRCGDLSENMGRREMQVLGMLMNNGNNIVPSSKMIENLWDGSGDISVIWVHISNIRKKLVNIHTRVVIRAVRGVGYSLQMR